MEAHIKLTRLAAVDPSVPKAMQHAFPISILAEGVGVPSEIFVYKVGVPGEAVPGDKFECVATVTQLFEIPLRSGMIVSQEKALPYYRTSQLDFVCRNQSEADEVWKDIQETVFWLVKNFNLDTVMQGTEFAKVGTTKIENDTIMTKPPLRYQLYFQPAGTATVTGDDEVQGISSPNSSLTGWLPATSAPSGWSVPPGAAFFYNIDADQNLQEIWPPAEPLDGNQLFRNGVLLPAGITHVITKDTIWWLDFDPVHLPGYLRKDDVQDGNAPWPVDYVNRNNPGAVSPNLTLVLFK